jgi:hypothetical protein
MEFSSFDEIVTKTNSQYQQFKQHLLDIVPASEKVLSLYNPNFTKNPFPKTLGENIDLIIYYKALSTYTYANKYGRGRVYSLDLQKLDEILDKIANDPRVYFINKHAFLVILCIYHEQRIAILIFNKYAKTYAARGKEGNWVFPMVKESLEFQKNTANSKQYKVRMDQAAREALFSPIKSYADRFISYNAKIYGFNEDEMKKDLTQFISSDLRTLETSYFPEFYRNIFLFKDWKSTDYISKIPSASAIKRDLVYDIFQMVLTDRNLIPSNAKNIQSRLGAKYNGNFYKYRVNTVKAIIGQ